jgi:hypothetical protein
LSNEVAAQGDEIGHLLGADAVAFAHFRGPDPGHLACPHRLQDHRPVRGELQGVAVAARYDRAAAPPFFLRHRGREEVVGFVASRLRGGEPAGRNELRQDIELLQQLGVEDATALVTFDSARIQRIVQKRPPL